MKECPSCKTCFEDRDSFCPHDRQPLQFSFACEIVLSGRYLLEKRLGKGGMGTVFKAKHKFIKTLHAIKIISPEVVQLDQTLLLRFHQEAVLAASIRHPNVVNVTDYGVENDSMPYLVMEYVDGISLTDYLQTEKRLSPEKAFEIVSQIARGLGEAHRRGIVHRDLKPLNVMLKNGSPLSKAVKVLDFGLAKIKASESYASLVRAKTIDVLGSPLYMSPEQWSNENIDQRADIYSIGVVLFQMLAGEVPFAGKTLVSIMYKHLQNEPPSFASLGVQIPPEIETVVRRTLAKDREQRPANVEELLDEFERALTKSGKIARNNSDSDSDFDLVAATQPSIQTTPHAVPIKTFADSNFASSFLTPSENETVNSFLRLPQTTDLKGKEHLAQDFIEAQNRVEAARHKADEAEKLAQEFAAAQKTAEEVRQKALAAQQQLAEEARVRVQAELESKLAAEREARERAEREAQRLLEEAKARKEAEERANELAKTALAAQQRAEDERRKAESEAQQRQIAEETRRRAESAALKLAAEAAAAQSKYEDAKREAEREAAQRLEAERKREQIEAEIKRHAQREAERRQIAEENAARQVKEQAARLEKQASEAEQQANEARLLVENEAKKRQQAEAARVKAEDEARRLAAEIIEAQKRLVEMQQFAESEARKREEESEARRRAEDSARSLSERVRQQNDDFAASNEKSENGGEIVVENALQKESFVAARKFQTQPQIHVNTTNFSQTNASFKRNSIKSAALIGGLAAVILATSIGGFFIYRSTNVDSINGQNNGAESTANKNSLPNEENRNEFSKIPPGASDVRLKNKMIEIKGGTFKMGRDDVSPAEGQFYGAQFPAHEVAVKDFYLDETEVTNEEYAEFVRATGHAAPENWRNGKLSEEQKKLPVTDVSYFDAAAFADWLAKRDKLPYRLPAESEWEYAARGGARENIFPWGNEWAANRANIATGVLQPVGTSADQSAFGVKEMLGNVVEWTATQFAYYPNFPENLKDKKYKNGGKFTLRGLSFSPAGSSLNKTNLNFTYRQPASAEIKQDFIGFRLACSLK